MGFSFFAFEGYQTINPLGQLAGAIIMFGLLGFLPAYIVTRIQSSLGVLRIPKSVELSGLDFLDDALYQKSRAEIIAAEEKESDR